MPIFEVSIGVRADASWCIRQREYLEALIADRVSDPVQAADLPALDVRYDPHEAGSRLWLKWVEVPAQFSLEAVEEAAR